MRRILLIVLFGLTAFTLSAAAQRRTAEIVVSGQPLAERVHAARLGRGGLYTADAASYRAALRQGKASLVAGAVSRGMAVTQQLETVLNAIIVEANDDDLIWLRA